MSKTGNVPYPWPAGDVCRPWTGFKLYELQGNVSSSLFLLQGNFVMNSANAPLGEYKFDYEVDPAMLDVAHSIKPVLQQWDTRVARTVHE